MKIKSLHIADFNQFQNFSLDLTYPEGHEKVGEPLDKVKNMKADFNGNRIRNYCVG